MPKTCCAVGCTNRKDKDKKSIPFYSMPKGRTPIERRRRKAWIKAIRREDWEKWSFEEISKAKICGEHFISGKRSDDPEAPNWIPTLFRYTTEAQVSSMKRAMERSRHYNRISTKRKRASETCIPVKSKEEATNDHTKPILSEVSSGFASVEVQCNIGSSEIDILNAKISQLDSELRDRNEEVYRLREENRKLKNKAFGFNFVSGSDEVLHFFTGITTISIFMWISSLLKDKVKKCYNGISAEDHLLIIFMKLRLGLLNRDIAYRFNLRTSMVSKIYRRWLPAVASVLQNFIIWPGRAEIRNNLPPAFKRKYSDCVTIIDCTEIFIERPKNLTARAQTWSNYKHNNTIKYLIGISPAGAVMFLSVGWGGRVSDKQITLESGFLNRISYGDCVLADRGFLIEEELNQRGAILQIPKFTKGKSQLSAKDVDESRKLSNVRIHVERVIGQLKKFRLIQNNVPLSQVDLLDNAMVVISALVNLQKSVVNVE